MLVPAAFVTRARLTVPVRPQSNFVALRDGSAPHAIARGSRRFCLSPARKGGRQPLCQWLLECVDCNSRIAQPFAPIPTLPLCDDHTAV
eukprot:6503003-Prymnesium_polylepis.3